MVAASQVAVSAQQQASLVAVATSSTQAAPRENRSLLARLPSLIGDVALRLEGPADDQLVAAVSECNGAIERYLELQRDVDDRDELVATAADDLRRLARLLVVVDRADAPFVMRQIRRVLGRFDARV